MPWIISINLPHRSISSRCAPCQTHLALSLYWSHNMVLNKTKIYPVIVLLNNVFECTSKERLSRQCYRRRMKSKLCVYERCGASQTTNKLNYPIDKPGKSVFQLRSCQVPSKVCDDSYWIFRHMSDFRASWRTVGTSPVDWHSSIIHRHQTQANVKIDQFSTLRCLNMLTFCVYALCTADSKVNMWTSDEEDVRQAWILDEGSLGSIWPQNRKSYTAPPFRPLPPTLKNVLPLERILNSEKKSPSFDLCENFRLSLQQWL